MTASPPRPPATAARPRSRSLLLLGLVALSLVANVALLASLARPPAATDEPTDARPAGANASTSSSASAATADADAPTPATLPPDFWPTLDATSPAELAAALRSAGFDEQLVRAIVWTRLSQAHADDLAALAAAPYWRRTGVRQDIWLRRHRSTMAGEMRPEVAEFKAIFGDSPFNLFPPSETDVSQARRGISPATGELLRELRRERDAAIGPNRRRRTNNGEPDAETRQLMEREAAANAQLQAQLRAQLTPAEYDAYLYRASNTAQRLRHRAGLVTFTQAEYDAVVRTLGPDLDPRSDLSSHADALTAILGEQRYADLVQAFTGDQMTNNLVQRLGLPAATAGQLQAIRNEAIERSRNNRPDRSLSREEQQAQRQAQQAALGEFIHAQLAATLPPEALAVYLEYNADWLHMFPPP